MKQFYTVLLLAIMSYTQLLAQEITGHLKQHRGQSISLTGFNYYKTFELAKDTIDAEGTFALSYPKDYKGMAVLKTKNNTSLVLLLTEPNIIISGTHLTATDSLQFTNSPQNQQFVTLATGYSQRSQAYRAWRYLHTKYKDQKPLSKQKNVLKAIDSELKRIEKADIDELNIPNKKDYLYWFLPKRKLVNDMPQTVHHYTERIPQNIKQFRNINFNHPNFKTSGLFKELIEGHYLLLENMGQSLDSIHVQMNISTDYLIENLKENETLLTEVSGQLFNYFEKRSLFKASEHLAVKMLSNNQCSLTDKLANKFEVYRKMKVGNKAPEILFPDNTKLREQPNNTLVVFGASWCPTCQTDLQKLLQYHNTWKAKGVDIVYISIDTDKAEFELAYKSIPWRIYCDFKGWSTQAAKDYHITGTPSFYLLDKDQNILVRPVSVEHVNSWVNYKL